MDLLSRFSPWPRVAACHLLFMSFLRSTISNVTFKAVGNFTTGAECAQPLSQGGPEWLPAVLSYVQSSLSI